MFGMAKNSTKIDVGVKVKVNSSQNTNKPTTAPKKKTVRIVGTGTELPLRSLKGTMSKKKI